jgi:hypothetical protein
MNQNIVDKLAERIINETNSSISCLTLYLGHKLDLFNSLKREGPIASEELSKKTKYSERYLREWLECMTANGYIDYDPTTKKFSISEEHARVLCDRDSIAYTIPFVYWTPVLSGGLINLSYDAVDLGSVYGIYDKATDKMTVQCAYWYCSKIHLAITTKGSANNHSSRIRPSFCSSSSI